MKYRENSLDVPVNGRKSPISHRFYDDLPVNGRLFRESLANAIASDENGNIVIHYKTNRDCGTHGDAESIRYWVNTDIASDSKTFDEEEDRLGYATIASAQVEGK